MIKSPNIRRDIYFDITIHINKIKDCISGENEEKVINVFKNLEYQQGIDYERQFPIGNRFVLDFAFPKLKICIEIDGKSHEKKKQIKIDKKRDKFLYDMGWVVIRIPDEKFFGNSGTFYKFLIKEVV